ncbi:riboflavin synthase [Romboutsia sedimentorum]|uniref:Riboflavin synthase n=1 Tax=Romboutsia sedimentorum TaxID=1368474 RepID=A0ABT7E538_9FIRM|nr:riboflavin synthase [Romboutsia sedimentorum]MDK2561987.1 riboflavin synthase [Romboutsia sedimentorum]MDK2586779.1 riboflavin synthase [Romboutsia sedimentorum]
MFTGIVEEIGEIEGIKKGEKSSKLIVRCNKILNQTKLGDSICTNGVCLTITNIAKNSFEAEVMPETLRKSNLQKLKIGSIVNLERAISLQTRLGGHIVSGHIDGIGEIIDLEKEDNGLWISIKTSQEVLKYIIYKGSISIDGISLTVGYVDNKMFKVSIIPHTLEKTILLKKIVGETVNLECDMIGKYIEKFLALDNQTQNKKNSYINEDFLKENGFF